MAWFVGLLRLSFACIIGLSMIEEYQTVQHVVDTSVGTIIGHTENRVIDGREYTNRAYLGIPFAKPPIGNRRFLKPEPAERFDAPYNASEFGAVCMQLVPYPEMSEDCLFLNIWVPDNQDADSADGHAVMVYIHGGGMILGSGNDYTGHTLASYGNVIVVTLNYRLTFFGFASIENELAPGNVGLFDQHLGLKWVNQNIAAFGGDKSRVTIFGESAGAISVSLQSFYTPNIGLFQRAIQDSGSAGLDLCWAPEPLKPLRILALNSNCTVYDKNKMIECLRLIDANKVLETMTELYKDPSIFFKLDFFPTLDYDIIKFSPYTVTKDVNAGRFKREFEFYRSLDLINGVNSHEGGSMLAYVGENLDDPAGPTRQTFTEELVPHIANTWSRIGNNVPQSVIDMIIYEYTDWSDPNNRVYLRDEFTQLCGDVTFVVPAIELSKIHANVSGGTAADSYMFSFRPKPSNHALPTPDWMDGANHGDEEVFVFGFDKDMPQVLVMRNDITEWEWQLSYRMMTYWSNFAKSGNPNTPRPVTSPWPNYNLDTQAYMEFNKNVSEGREYFAAQRATFWLDIVPSTLASITECDKSNVTSGHPCTMISLELLFTITVSMILIVSLY